MFQRHPAARIVSDRSATLQGKNFDYKLVRSPSARTVRLKVGMQNGLEVIIPRRFHLSHVDHIIAEHEQWILRQLDRMETGRTLREKHQLRDGCMVSILNQTHKVKIIAGLKKRPSVKRVQTLIFTHDSAIVDGHALHIYCDGSIKQARETLEDYLRGIAEKYFAKRTPELAEMMGVTFNNITVRGQKTRWGSCTRQKNLNFNWRLIMLPLEVAESVIVHELAHTVHMNHSRAFYGLVERFCSNYRKLQKHLRNPQFLV